MNKLRKYIRQTILAEGMNRVQDLPDGIGISIRSGGVFGEYTLNYCYDGPVSFYLLNRPPAKVWGNVTLGQMHPYEPAYGHVPGDDKNLPEDTSNLTCGGAFQIYTADAADGWGPLLYDVAIELATLKGAGLVSDRSGVSYEAQDVWSFYMYNRSDVEQFQCDDHMNTLTDTLDDNVDMNIPMAPGRIYNPRDLKNDPLSKRYTKPSTTINMLKSLGKLHTRGVEL